MRSDGLRGPHEKVIQFPPRGHDPLIKNLSVFQCPAGPADASGFSAESQMVCVCTLLSGMRMPMLREVQELAGGRTVEGSPLPLDFPSPSRVCGCCILCHHRAPVLGLGVKVPRQGLHLWRSSGSCYDFAGYFRVRPLVLGKDAFPQFPMISWRM